MIKSMTGFGRGEFNDGKRNIIVEIRAVNHRYSDISIRMPRRYSFAEERLKAIVKDVAKRGKIEVSINVENLTENDTNIKLNTMVAKQYYENLLILKKELEIQGDLTLQYISSLPDVLKAIPDLEDEEEIFQCLAKPTVDAVQRLKEMREAEGKKLAKDMTERGAVIQEIVAEIEKKSPEIVKTYQEKLFQRIKELTEDAIDIPEDRIILEAAVFADKSNVTEELVRLNSHIEQMNKIIAKDGEPEGKKLDFLVQEMNREANTIGSKANALEITAKVLDLKSEIEKIREQVQNIE